MRQRMMKEQSKMCLEELRLKIEAAPDMDAVRAILDDAIDDSRKSIAEGPDTFPAEKSSEIFAEDDIITIKPLREAVKEYFLRLLKETSFYPHMYQDQTYKDLVC